MNWSNIAELINNRAQTFPDKIAYTFLDTKGNVDTLTFPELKQRCLAFSFYISNQQDFSKKKRLYYSLMPELIM